MGRLFNGTSDSIDFASTAILNPDRTAMTITAWGRPNFMGAGQGSIFNAAQYEFRINEGTSRPRFTLFTVTDVDATTVTSTNNNTWQHYAVVVTATNVRFVITSLTGVQTAENVANSDAFSGAAPAGETIGGGNNWKGSMAHVGVWIGTALTDAQIQTVAGALSPASVPGVDAYWPLTGADPELDTSGNGINSTSVRTTTFVADPVPAFSVAYAYWIRA